MILAIIGLFLLAGWLARPKPERKPKRYEPQFQRVSPWATGQEGA